MTRKLLIGSLALVAALSACIENESLEPATERAGLVDARFARYVAMGNSITAGYQSGGINDSTQLLSYAKLLADRMGTEYHAPLLAPPGCPPPLVNIFTRTPVGDPGPQGCRFRSFPIAERLNNVAVPGAAVLDIYDPLGSGNRSNTLTSIMGGGRSQVENAVESQPTFVTVWIGSNDWLGAALDTANPGNPALVTPPETFAARYGAMLDSIEAIGSVQGGVLIGAVQPVFAAYFTQGRAWKAFELGFDALSTPLNFLDVSAACLAFTVLPTGDTAWTAVPFPIGGAALALANAKKDSVLGGKLNPANLVPASITCADNRAITANEMAGLMGAVALYNLAIRAAAGAEGPVEWAFVDPNAALASEAVKPGAILPFPAFPGLPGVPAEASQNTPFGYVLSRDGIHPSTISHGIMKDVLVDAINAKYGTSLTK